MLVLLCSTTRGRPVLPAQQRYTVVSHSTKTRGAAAPDVHGDIARVRAGLPLQNVKMEFSFP